MKTIAVDFDGVIHKYSKGWHDGTIYDEPMEFAKQGLEKLMEQYAVFILTTRNAFDVAQWITRELKIPTKLRDDGIEFWNTQGTLLVTNKKLPAIAYIDDRAVKFTNWQDLKIEE